MSAAEGGPCVPHACAVARALAAHAQQAVRATDAFPGLDGAVLRLVYQPEGDDALRCETDGTVSWTRERQGQEPVARAGVSLREVLGLLGWA